MYIFILVLGGHTTVSSRLFSVCMKISGHSSAQQLIENIRGERIGPESSTSLRLFYGLLFCCFVALTAVEATVITTPETFKGITWLQTQINADGSVIGEDTSIAEKSQVRCEVATAIYFFGISSTNRAVCVVAATEKRTEILSRGQQGLEVKYVLDESSVIPYEGYRNGTVIDTAWLVWAQHLLRYQWHHSS